MACNADRKRFIDNLVMARDVVPYSKDDDQTHYLIFQDGRMCVMSNMFMLSMPTDITLEHLVNVNIKDIGDYIRKVKTKDFMIGLVKKKDSSGENQTMTLGIRIGNRKRVNLPIIDDYHYDSNMMASVDDDGWKPIPESFINAMQFTAWATNVSDQAYAYTVVANGKMYAMDGVSLVACFDMGEAGREAFGDTPVYIHADCLTFIQKYCGYDASGEHSTRFLVKNGWFHILTANGAIMSSRTRADVEVDIAWYEEQLAHDMSDAFCFTKEFQETLERVNPFSGTDADSKRIAIQISNRLTTGNTTEEASGDTSFLSVYAIRTDGSCASEVCTIRHVNNPVKFCIGFSAISELCKYGEYYSVYNGRLTCVGSTDDGTPTGAPMFRATAMLYA